MSVLLDVFPDAQPMTELRARIFAERRETLGDRLHLNLGAYVDGLVAERREFGGNATVTDALVRPADLYAEWRGARFDLRAGASRIVWGRLDEFQPGDVVNPIDVTRFFLEGRSEARLPVALVRARGFLPAGVVIEGIVVPLFRSGRFDQLDEPSSPFNVGSTQHATCPVGLAVCMTLVPVRREPERSWSSVQGGVRGTGTVGRLDVGLTVYRGFEPFPLYALGPQLPSFAPNPPIVALLETFPRFTMVAGDFETIRGPWGIRGEAAYFADDTLQSFGRDGGFSTLTAVPGRSLDAGVGIDRRAGDYRISGNVIASRRRVDRDEWQRAPVPFDVEIEDLDVLLIGWAERSFARNTRVLRTLGAWNPGADSAFVRGTGAFNLRDNVWLEGSAGWLRGKGVDILSRLSTRDFLYVRLRVHF